MNSMAIIQLVSVTLGLSTPLILLLILQSGINNGEFKDIKKRKYSIILGISVALWSVLIWGLILQGFFSYTEGDVFPSFLLALIFPLVIVLSLFRPSDFNSIIDHIEMRVLVAGQFWRVLGAVFFLVALSGSGPKEFIGSGFGDLITGLLAMATFLLITKRSNLSNTFIWVLTMVGMADLIIVLFIMIGYYPIWSDAVPSTEAAGTYPMMLIVGLAAPVALLLHVFTIMKIFKSNPVGIKYISKDQAHI